MLLPTIPAPMTTTLACAGRLLTRIPSSVFVVGSQHSDDDEIRKGPRSADPREHLLHVGAEDPTAEPGDERPDHQAARPAAGPDHGDLNLGASGRGWPEPVAPLASRRPGVRFDGGHGDLAGRRIPFVAVSLPGEDVAFGHVGPVGALPVDAKVGLVDLRPDVRSPIAEVG